MLYTIAHDIRAGIDSIVDQLPPTLTADELAYLILRVILRQEPRTGAEVSAITGALEVVKLEFHRKLGGPILEKALRTHGDPFPRFVT